jgi:hypothetical protein
MAEQVIHPGDMNVSQGVVSAPPKGIGRVVDAARNAFYGAVVAYEMLPVDEASRTAVFTATQAVLDNPYATAGAVGAATFAIEASSAVATANLLGTQSGEKFTSRMQRVLGKIGLGGIRTNTLADAAVAMTAGVPLAIALKQQQDPTRTVRQNRRFGVKAAGGVSAAVGAATYFIAEGVSAVESIPEKVGVGAVAVAGMMWAANTLRSRIARNHGAGTAPDIESIPIEVAPDYNLPAEELTRLETDMVEKARLKGGRGISAVWISSNSPYANYIRTKEREVFDNQHIPELFSRYEDESAFLAIVDTRRGKGRVIRGTRITSPNHNENGVGMGTEVRMAMIQDMVESGQIDDEQLRGYYGRQGIDLNKCLSIETNFRIGERAPRRMGFMPISQLAYLAMYNRVVRHDHNASDVAIFAHINSASQASLNHFGVDIEPLAGRNDLKTPSIEGKFDDDYTPVAFLNTPRTRRAMQRASLIAPKEVQI